MKCPSCQHDDSKVIDSRVIHKGTNIRRRRECIDCKHRFTTYEYIQENPIMVIKKSGDREEYDRSKLEKSFRIACKKRPIPQRTIQEAIDLVEEQISNISNTEIAANKIGEFVMNALRSIDKVAFIRFASVYRQFRDIGEFQAQIEGLKK